MADEQDIEKDSSFPDHSTGNKDLWLFLIVLDAIFLCVFGFFIYKHFSGKIFTPSTSSEVLQKEEAPSAEIVTMEDESVWVETPNTEGEPKKETQPTQEIETSETTVVESFKGVVQEEQPLVKEQPEEQKQSVIISNEKGKYRQVTFRWFGDGDKVSIVSGFTMSKPKELKKVGTYWETTLAIAPGSYKFLYIVDGKNRLDPYVPEKDGRSVLEIK